MKSIIGGNPLKRSFFGTPIKFAKNYDLGGFIWVRIKMAPLVVYSKQKVIKAEAFFLDYGN